MEEFRKSARGQVLVRGALMLVFGLLLNLAITLVGVLAFIQFLWMLVTTDRNQFIADISSDLSRWMSATVQFFSDRAKKNPSLGLPKICAEIKVATLLLFGVFWPITLFAQAELNGQITHIRDGDTIEVGDIAIRLNGLTCDERGTTLGDRATAYLRSQVLGKTATCTLNGKRTYDRLVGRCATEELGDIEHILSCRHFVDAARDMIQEVNMLKRRGA